MFLYYAPITMSMEESKRCFFLLSRTLNTFSSAPTAVGQVRVWYMLDRVNRRDRFFMKKPLRSSARGASFHTKHASNARYVRVVITRCKLILGTLNTFPWFGLYNGNVCRSKRKWRVCPVQSLTNSLFFTKRPDVLLCKQNNSEGFIAG
jgi:hypothetical protein